MRTLADDGGTRTSSGFSHDLLLHDSDAELIAATLAFVRQGLAAVGKVLVLGTDSRIATLRDALGTRPGLTYARDRDLYQSPTATLFSHQRAFEESSEPTALWVTGTVPLGEERVDQAAWARYESLVNEVLNPYDFHALCTYDTQALPDHVLEAAKATHPHVSTHGQLEPSPEYQEPAAFLSSPLAAAPTAPVSAPSLTTDLHGTHDLAQARRSLRRGMEPSGFPRAIADDLLTATNEVLTNGLEHGAPPVRLDLWAEPLKLTCRVTDRGRGMPDLLSGYRSGSRSGPRGLWVARRLCTEIVVRNPSHAGCDVVLITI